MDILLPEEHQKDIAGSSETKKGQPEQKLLFTVKPGGIAGYLGLYRICSKPSFLTLRPASLTNTASYVDITAKTDTYVGFLPSHSLERILEKRPIVLLTLAKRLISLLSPLGTLYVRQFPGFL